MVGKKLVIVWQIPTHGFTSANYVCIILASKDTSLLRGGKKEKNKKKMAVVVVVATIKLTNHGIL